MLGFERADAAERAHLGHPPGVLALHAVIVAESIDHRRRAGRAAHHHRFQRAEFEIVLLHVGEQREPHGGNTRRVGDFLRLEELVQALAVEARAGENQLRAVQRREIGNAPGVDVEHGHDRKDHRARRAIHHVGERRGIGVQNGGTVGVEHALRVAGRAGGIAQARGGPFVELRPLVVPVLACDQLLVAEQIGQIRLRHVGAIGHRHPALDALARRGELLGERRERQVEEDVAVFRVVDDEHQLLGKKPRIDGVDHGAHSGDAVVELEVAEAVPGERADALALSHAQPRERLGEALRAPVRLAVRIPVDRTLDGARDDFRVAVAAVGMRDDRRDEQRHVHHLGAHGWSPGSRGPGKNYPARKPVSIYNREEA